MTVDTPDDKPFDQGGYATFTGSNGTYATLNISNLTVSGNTVTSAYYPLFGTWVTETKKLQEEFFQQKFEDFTHEQLVEWVRINVLAAEDELHETLGEISWKPWASAQYFNREAYLGEIVDVLHFIGNLLAGAGITDTELNAAYREKMERNRKRQTEGYTGVDKCKGCNRAKDDIEAHGGMTSIMPDGFLWCKSCVEGPQV